MMEPLPYYKWHWRDYRANRRVQRMSWQAKGLYRELLDEFWAEGYLPVDHAALADICGCSTEEFSALWPEMEGCWEVVDGGLVNAKMDSLRTEVNLIRAIQKRKSGIPFASWRSKHRARFRSRGWGKKRIAVFLRDDYTCVYCGKRGNDLDCDHVVPVAKGGSDEESNLVTACAPCNRSKGAKDLDEWRAV